MAKKTVDIVKAFGSSVEEAAAKLAKKYIGFQITHPAYKDVAFEDLEFDCDDFIKDGKVSWWAKLFTTITVQEETAITNKPVVKSAKTKTKKKVA